MTTKKAFEYLIKQKEWGKLCGIGLTDQTSYKYNYKKGLVKPEKIKELLVKSKLFKHPPPDNWELKKQK